MMETISCEDVMERLWAFLDGELDELWEARVRGHLDLCRMCYPHYDFQHAYFVLMQRLAEIPSDERVRRRVLDALQAESSRESP